MESHKGNQVLEGSESYNQVDSNKRIPEETNKEKAKIVKKSFTGFTDKDIRSLSEEDALKYDKRTLCEYYSGDIKNNHVVLSLFFKKSMIEPLPLRVYQFFFELSLNFALNALVYTDTYIERDAIEYIDTGEVYHYYLIM